MEAGILFHFARRTDDCGDEVARAVNCLGINISEVKPCTNNAYLKSRMANMLKKVPTVFIVGRSEEKRPDCAGLIFKTLGVPLDGEGEPKGVMPLHGKEKTGYVVESVGQVIVIMPDFPDEIAEMLPRTCERLKQKFGLKGELPAPPGLDCEKIAADCLHSAKYGKI